MRVLYSTLLALSLLAAPAAAAPIRIVAAENFYGDIASQIGGAEVEVVSILSNPDQDPHLFEASAQTAIAIAKADLIILNGADYDPWMMKLLQASAVGSRRMINVGILTGAKPGANPHLWYDPKNVETLSAALAAQLGEIDPNGAARYRANAVAFVETLAPLRAKIETMRLAYVGAPIVASEPVFDYMAERLGLKLRDQRFALAVMNNAEPSARDVAGFEDDLTNHRVRAMLYNAQADEPAVRRLVEIARAQKIPVIGLSETEPPGKTYSQWMLGQLEALDSALGLKS